MRAQLLPLSPGKQKPRLHSASSSETVAWRLPLPARPFVSRRGASFSSFSSSTSFLRLPRAAGLTLPARSSSPLLLSFKGHAVAGSPSTHAAVSPASGFRAREASTFPDDASDSGRYSFTGDDERSWGDSEGDTLSTDARRLRLLLRPLPGRAASAPSSAAAAEARAEEK